MSRVIISHTDRLGGIMSPVRILLSQKILNFIENRQYWPRLGRQIARMGDQEWWNISFCVSAPSRSAFFGTLLPNGNEEIASASPERMERPISVSGPSGAVVSVLSFLNDSLAMLQRPVARRSCDCPKTIY